MEAFIAFLSDPKMGALGITLCWLWFERQGRLDEQQNGRRLQAERDQLLERVLNGLNNSTNGMKAMVDAENATHTVLSSVNDLIVSHGVRAGDPR